MTRPELGDLVKGQAVIMRDRHRASQASVREMLVVTLGPKWVGLCDPRWAGTEAQISHTRRFLLRDQREGEPGKRIGYACSFATHEQHEYDVKVDQAVTYVRDVAGLDVRRGVVPFAGDDGILVLARILSLTEDSWRP